MNKPFNQDILWTEIMIKNPFRFWKSVKKATPNLSMTAICLLSLPVASADAERFWSVMASIHTLKCNCLINARASKIAKIKWHLITTKLSNNLTQTPMPIDNLKKEILDDLLDNITNFEKQGNEEIQNNGEFSKVEFDQSFDFDEINEISINIV
nr:2226_t:CDS:2 [Entrophospora candida]